MTGAGTTDAVRMLASTRFSAHDLMLQDFPPAIEVVHGLIQAGENLIVSPPKTGKSWLMLDLAFAAASGGRFLGSLPVEQRPVLYMALEDGSRRLQKRMRMMGVTGENAPNDLDFLTQTEENRTPTDTIRDFVEVNGKRSPMVILDTLGKVKPLYPKKSGGESDYEREYRIMGELKQTVDAVDGASLIVVHHTRKDTSTGDFVDSVSGTNGLAGAADCIIALIRERSQPHGTLKVTSRDASEGEYSVDFDSEHGRWSMAGGSLQEAERVANTGRLVNGLSESQTAIIGCVNRHPEGVTAPQVSQELEMPPDKVRRYLTRAAGTNRIQKLKRGTYGPCSEDTSVPSVLFTTEAKRENASQNRTPRIYSVPAVPSNDKRDTWDTQDTPTAGDSNTTAVHLNANTQGGGSGTEDHDIRAFLAELPEVASGFNFHALADWELKAVIDNKIGLWQAKAREELTSRV